MIRSSEFVIETVNLGFGFHRRSQVLKGLNLQVKRGSIYGFLGPNGSGKTTTIRLVLGLLHGQGNAVRLFGKHLSEDRMGILSKVGALIEQPSLYEHLSGYDNLDIARRIRNVSRLEAVRTLDLVKLSDVAHRRVREYSLGMKQRLGLALAFLGEPELLILDEPVNGLDPGGIAQVRDILNGINRERGTTILVSSHLLSEVEKMVTHIGIIAGGELVFQGSTEELLALGARGEELCMETANNGSAVRLLQEKYKVTLKGERLVVPCESRVQVAAILRQVIEAGIDVYEASVEEGGLEEVFLKLTESEQR
jgi:lantibiotic transport system ATP-binding protein